jgi:hypothetical protein
MKRSVLFGVPTLALAISASAAVTEFSFESQFSPGQLPLIDTSAGVNGSWHGDIYQNGGGFQEVGGLGLATGDGIAYSQTFGPVDVTNGHGTLGDHTTTTQPPNPFYDPSRPIGPFNQPLLPPVTTTVSIHASIGLTAGIGLSPLSFRVTLYDTSGGSSSWTVSPTTAIGQFGQFFATETAFSGNLDWSHVDQFSISGVGGNQSFHAAFDGLGVSTSAVPEPSSVGVAVGLALLTFAGWRKVKKGGGSRLCLRGGLAD